MCKAMEDMRNEALEQGRNEGRIKSLSDSVKRLKAALGFTDQQIRELLNISPEDWALISAQV